jgi:hypothetical protein
MMAAPVDRNYFEDLVCLVCLVAVTGLGFFLQSHIFEYALNLVARQKLVMTLFFQNIDLKRKIKE